MTLDITNALVTLFAAIVGGAAGWLIRYRFTKRVIVVQRPASAETEGEAQIDDLFSEAGDDGSDQSDRDSEVTSEILSRLNEIADNMAEGLSEHSSQIKEASDNLNADVESPDTVLAAVTKLLAANDSLQQQLDEASHRLDDQQRELETRAAEARTDALTGLANRRAFDDALELARKRFAEQDEPVCVMMLDVDHFKKFNDTHGHQAGDETLREVARLVKEAIGDEGLATRYGGEEFAVIFPESHAQQILWIAEHARTTIADQQFSFEGVDLRVTVSVGLAELRSDETIQDVVRRADEALYTSKEAGRNCGHFHDGQKHIPLSSVLEQPEPIDEVDAVPVIEVGAEPTSPVEREIAPTPTTAVRKEFCRTILRLLNDPANEPLSIIFLRVDKLEQIYEEHGAGTTDMVLKASQQFLGAAVKDSDHLVQLDEYVFALIFTATNLSDGMRIADRVRQAISRCRLKISQGALQFTVSLGVAQAGDGEQPESLVERTGEALDGAIEAGTNQCFCHDGEDVREALAELSVS